MARVRCGRDSGRWAQVGLACGHGEPRRSRIFSVENRFTLVGKDHPHSQLATQGRSGLVRPSCPARMNDPFLQLHPNRVNTFRVICSICWSRPASPWAQSVDPDVTTVAPALFVYAPSTAWP